MTKHMTDEEIHNIYLHMSGKAEGIAEVTGTADFPVLFARAILEFDRMGREWVGLTMEDKQEYVALDYGGNRLDAMDWAEKRLKEKNHG
jgi:hypothetical protein